MAGRFPSTIRSMFLFANLLQPGWVFCGISFGYSLLIEVRFLYIILFLTKKYPEELVCMRVMTVCPYCKLRRDGVAVHSGRHSR